MNEDRIKLSSILILDDQEYNIALLERILKRAGYINIVSAKDASGLPDLLASVNPDIVLLDLHLPVADGIEALMQIREHRKDSAYLPVLMLTEDVTPEAKKHVLQAGSNDYITKPYDRIELILRIENLLKCRLLQVQLIEQNDSLEERVRERTAELQLAKDEILKLLGRASEYRDDMTGQHTQRVGYLSGLIAEQLGLGKRDVDLIRMASPLHDIGKIGIPDELLLKPGRLETHEFEKMKQHTTIGASILQDSYFTELKLAGIIAQAHHEKWDGSGYPLGLKGEEIPLAARIVALADFFDALTHERPYKRAWTAEEAIAEIVKQKGRHFDPQVADAFVHLYNQNKLQYL